MQMKTEMEHVYQVNIISKIEGLRIFSHTW